MSFVISVYVPEGIVMAADSRQSVRVEWKEPGKNLPPVETVSSDSIYKVFYLAAQNTGITAYGDSLAGGRPIASFIERFVEESLEPEDRVSQVAGKMRGFFFSTFPEADTAFHVAGFEKQGRQSVPYVYHVTRAALNRVNTRPDTKEISFGCTWGGQADVMGSLLINTVTGGELPLKPPILWETFSVQDAVDFSLYAVRTTIDTMRFQARIKNVGGPIDVLLLTPRESSFIQKKELHGQGSDR